MAPKLPLIESRPTTTAGQKEEGRGKVSAFPERRSKQVSKQSGKTVTKPPANEGAKNGSNMSKTHKTAPTDKGGKTACH